MVDLKLTHGECGRRCVRLAEKKGGAPAGRQQRLNRATPLNGLLTDPITLGDRIREGAGMQWFCSRTECCGRAATLKFLTNTLAGAQKTGLRCGYRGKNPSGQTSHWESEWHRCSGRSPSEWTERPALSGNRRRWEWIRLHG